MTHRSLKNNNNLNHSMPQIIVRLFHWTLLFSMALQQIKITTAANKFKGDHCISKHKPGICKEWSECPILKTLIESGEYTSQTVVSCGFGVKEELICCPVIENEPKIEATTEKTEDRSGKPRTTEAPVKDFWVDLLKNTTSSTTSVPDFWEELLKSTTSTTTTSTTIKPLIVGDQKLNQSSEFFDFNVLLGGNQQSGSQQIRPTGSIIPNNNPFLQAAVEETTPVNTNNNVFLQAAITKNFDKEFNTGPVNNFNNGPPGLTNFNNSRGHNSGNVNFNAAQHNNGRGPMNGQVNFNNGPHNGNGRGQFNGRGPRNNVGIRNIHGMENQNQGFVFPANNMRPNPFFMQHEAANHRPGRPINNMQVQNSNFPVVNIANNHPPNNQIINNIDKDKGMNHPITNIFTPSSADQEIQNSASQPNQNINGPQPVVWLTPQELTNSLPPGNFQIMSAAENQFNTNGLEEAPATNFVQQPVIVKTWPSHVVHGSNSNPVHVVYENLVNSGLVITQAQENQNGNAFNQQPQQVIVLQPQQSTQGFVQHPQIIYQQPQVLPQMIQQPLQMESSDKRQHSTSSFQPVAQQPHPNTIFNVQSPPIHALDPFKPFEFRPPSDDKNTFAEDNNFLSSDTADTKLSNTDRPVLRACQRIIDGLKNPLTQHILGGTPAERGEFPHMAAIGYSFAAGDGGPPYDIRCGGTLIDKRFVLTAAHCVSDIQSVPSIVRLGVVNFTDVNEMNDAVELRIKRTYIHDDYQPGLTYNDIAILEMESDVEYSEYIYPVCLHTDVRDPDTKIKLWVTGWGTFNTTTRSFSNILLKAPLHTAPLENCNKSFTDYGLTRRNPQGVISTQFCAEDKDHNKDSCQGDSGGPLNMIVDETTKEYRLVGVVSSGFGCASSTPGLYTRVAAYVDFIENIVWPNGVN